MRRHISAYRQAIYLEWVRERTDYRWFGIHGVLSHIPRVIALPSLKRLEYALTILMPFAKLIWLTVVAPIFFASQGARYATTHLLLSRRRLVAKSIYLGTSSADTLQYVGSATPGFPEVMVVSPFRGSIEAKIHPTVPRVDLMELCGPWTCVRAVLYAIIVNWTLLASTSRKYIWWGFTAFQWYATYFVLYDLKLEQIWVSNHYDRWLSLATAIKGASATIVQHGSLMQGGSHAIAFSFEPKIKNVSNIYVFDDRSKELFGSFIDCAAVRFVLLERGIGVQEWRQGAMGRSKVLIIGSSGNLRFFESLIDRLLKRFPGRLDIGIRHHPLQRKRVRTLEGRECWQLTSQEPIPLADVVVSYGSTLDADIERLTDAKIVSYAWRPDTGVDTLLNGIERDVAAALSEGNLNSKASPFLDRSLRDNPNQPNGNDDHTTA
jgi:hypothetical protein